MRTSAPVVPWGLLLLVLNVPALVVAQSGWVLDSSIDRRAGTITRQAIASSLERNAVGSASRSMLMVSCDSQALSVTLMSFEGALFQYTTWQPGATNDAQLFVRRNSTGPLVAETWPLYSPFSAFVEGPAAIGLANDLARDTLFIVQNSSSSGGEVATFRIRNRSVVAALVASCKARSRSP